MANTNLIEKYSGKRNHRNWIGMLKEREQRNLYAMNNELKKCGCIQEQQSINIIVL